MVFRMRLALNTVGAPQAVIQVQWVVFLNLSFSGTHRSCNRPGVTCLLSVLVLDFNCFPTVKLSSRFPYHCNYACVITTYWSYKIWNREPGPRRYLCPPKRESLAIGAALTQHLR